MRRLAALLVLGTGALLLSPGAVGVPDVPGDPTPPVVTPLIAGTLGDAGWYTTNVTVNWSISDPESIILSTSGCDARTFNADTVGTVLTCTAESDGGITSVGKTFKVDKTAPGATATPSRAADSNGWYNHDLSVDFNGNDGTSGLQSCSPDAAYAGPDTAATTVNGSCRDVAGNTSPASLPLKFDETAPQASAAAGRAADANGWYNHAVTVTFSGSDATSGVETCSQQTYAGPDDASVALTGTCRDRAGNVSGSAGFSLKYDETPPQASATPGRPSDANGWYNHALAVSFTGSDVTSGLDVCDAAKTYTGPDTSSASVSGSCRDLAGNLAPRSFALKYDATAPGVTATPARSPNANGWYNAAIGVTFAGTDQVSGVASCDAAKTYSGPDSGTASVGGTCIDTAGNAGAAAVPVKYDATSPLTSATPGRPADANGWFNHALTVSFTGSDATSGIDSCDAAKSYGGPDTASASLGGACRDKAGNSTSGSFSLKYDGTPPSVTPSPDRAPNAAGWYRLPVTVGFTGGDATSGLESCEAAKTYSSPDSASASVAGTCRDRAANVGTGTLGLKYDATAPAVTATPDRGANANGWFNAPVTVAFASTDPTSGVESCDAAKTYGGPDNGGASLTGSCSDKAGNSASRSFGVKYDATAPVATATGSRTPDANGWFNHALTVSFGATDATSGLDTCPADKSYSGPDSGAATVSGTCLDKAGNPSTASFPLKYDATAPLATATTSRTADANGWFNHALTVGFAGSDTTSGLDSCDAAKSYSGPDTAATSLSGNCRDKAGNSAIAAAAFKYDATAPAATASGSRAPDANGWFNHALTVNFAATDATSGVDTCPAAKSYAGPDIAATSVTGTCFDKAGNPTLASFPLKYDATAPLATATPSRTPDANGWFNQPLTVSFAATDATSGVDTCPAAKSYAGPDSGATSVTGACQDKAGNVAGASFALKYDASAPIVAATPARAPNVNGWYRAPLSVDFTATDATSGVANCDATKTYSGPDAAAASVSGSCRDNAGNSAAQALALKYDATAPQVTGSTPARAPNAANWYNAALQVTFSGADATSGVESCSSPTYAGPDSATASASGSCVDRAGNTSATSSFALKYDATAPQTTATPSRNADANGWFNHGLTVSFAATDATSGLDSCDAAKTYSGPDTSATSLSGNCRDKAGNSAAAATAFKYDATAPAATASPSRQPNAQGWFNAPLSVSFVGTDATSGLESCDAAKSYGGPDSAAATISGTCRDNAGNSATPALLVKYDATAPTATAAGSRNPDANGWFRAPLTVNVTGADLTSGVASCTPQQPYSGPDTAAVSLSGSCTDRAGNGSAASVYGFKYDATAPQVASAVAARPPDRAPWYNRPVAFAVQGSDAMSGLDACPTLTYRGPDAAAASVLGACLDKAGNVGTRAFPLAYDATGPDVTATPTRPPDANDWYNRPLSVSFAGADGLSGLESCDGPSAYDGPDTTLAVVGGTCLDKAGNVGLSSLSVRYDATPPQVTGAAADRAPDGAGWYNHALVVSFQGRDETSGIQSCTQAPYAGPDAGAASVAGSCADRAGNGSQPASFALRYDGTAPSLSGIRVKTGNRRAELSWTASPDTSEVEIRRGAIVVYQGAGTSFTDTNLENGVNYRYTLRAFDEARNAASSTVSARPTAPLFAPLGGSVVTAPPRLAWKPVAGATHYQVQLWRRGRILTAWPRAASFQLKRSWTYAGRRYKLTPGRYRWFVWPGFKQPRSGKYGTILGSSSFVVRAPKTRR